MRMNQPTVSEMMNRFYNEFNNSEMKDCYRPAVNIKEHDDAFEMSFMVPGMKKEDFKINLEDEILTVSAEVETEKEEKKKGYSRKEFAFGSFKRRFSVPDSIEAEKISAAYNNGILEVTLPKKEEAKPQPARMIDVA